MGKTLVFQFADAHVVESELEILQQHIPAGGKFGIVDSSSSGDEPLMARFL